MARGFKTTTAPSRLGRKQISVYLDPEMAERVRATCTARRATVQQLLGSIINERLTALGSEEILTNPRLSSPRPIRAAPRSRATTSRQGRVAINGWYEGGEVDRLRIFCASRRTTIQELGETAVAGHLSV